MPLLLTMRLYGGFGVAQMIQIELLCIGSSLFGASVGLLMSCWGKKAWRAVAMSYFWIGLWWIILPMTVGFGTGLLIDSEWFADTIAVDESQVYAWLYFVLGILIPPVGMAGITQDLVAGNSIMWNFSVHGLAGSR